MFFKSLQLFLLVLLNYLQYSMWVYLFSSFDLSLYWSFFILTMFLIFSLITDKIILFFWNITPLRNEKLIQFVTVQCSLRGIEQMNLFVVSGDKISILKSLLGGHSLCIGSELLENQNLKSNELRDKIVHSLVEFERRYNKTDQLLYLFFNLLMGPLKIFNFYFKNSFVTSVLYWFYFPLKYILFGSKMNNDEQLGAFLAPDQYLDSNILLSLQDSGKSKRMV